MLDIQAVTNVPEHANASRRSRLGRERRRA